MQARHLLEPLVYVCARRRLESPEEKLRMSVLDNTLGFFRTIENGGTHLSTGESERCLQCVTEALLAYTELARRALDKGRLLWNIVPKHHYWFHIGHQAKFLNPRVGWVFRDEDYVGRIAKIGAASTFGIPSHKVSKPLFGKYRAGMHLRWERRLRI